MRSETLTACDVCGFESAKIRHIPRTYGKGKALLVIEDVPVVSCPHCGSSYLTAQTLKTLDQIKGDRQTKSTLTEIAVASF
jgi:YgiT-type zinc finger domain-containing protein